MGKNLRNMAKEMNSGIAFMEGRTKADFNVLIDEIVTIVDYDFIPDDGHDYVVFLIAEDAENFYFGGKVLTDAMHEFDKQGMKGEIQKDGLVVLFGEKKGKKFTYATCEFFPQTEDGFDRLPTFGKAGDVPPEVSGENKKEKASK